MTAALDLRGDAGSADRPDGLSPFRNASRPAVALLVSMVLSREESIGLLEALGDEPDAAQLRIGAVCRSLSKLALDHPRAGLLLDGILRVRLAGLARRFEPNSIFRLARIWADGRDTLDGPAMAALLWVVARSDSPLFRGLEDAIVDELVWRGARLVFDPCTREACPRG